MLGDALDYPTTGGGVGALFAGGLALVAVGVLSLAAVVFPPLALAALLPYLLVRGYYVAALRGAIGTDEPEAPGVGDWGGLLTDGSRAVAVTAAYLLPAVVLLGIAGAGSALRDLLVDPTGAGAPSLGQTVADGLTGLSFLFGLLALVAAAYLLPAGGARLAYTGSARDAFDLRHVVRAAFTEDYAVGWMAALALQAVLFPVAFALGVLFLTPFAVFFVAVSVRYVYGVSYGNALGLDPLESGEPTSTTPAPVGQSPHTTVPPDPAEGDDRRGAGTPVDVPGPRRSYRQPEEPDPSDGEDPLSDETGERVDATGERAEPGTAGRTTGPDDPNE